MKVIIAGSRHFTDLCPVCEGQEFIDRIEILECKNCGLRVEKAVFKEVAYSKLDMIVRDSQFEITQVVSGGAKGVDALGEFWAEDNGTDLKVFHAEWNRYGRGAGSIRNKQMANYADALIVIYDSSKSKGTTNMIKQAKQKGLKIYEYDFAKVKKPI
jgi:orotate phosphoribosyltransferase-like protein